MWSPVPHWFIPILSAMIKHTHSHLPLLVCLFHWLHFIYLRTKVCPIIIIFWHDFGVSVFEHAYTYDVNVYKMKRNR
jgi:hypothetical protein